MKKRVFIIHGWGGFPEEAWFPWLKKELEQKGFEVTVPIMPNPAEPKIETWVPHLASLVGEPDEQTYLVGHSIGCQTIMRYVASLDGKKIGGILLVAGFFELIKLDDNEDEEILLPWIETPFDYQKITKSTNNVTAIFSDNDQWVPLKNVETFKERLGNPTIIVEHNKQHFSESSGIKELPSVLEAILKYDQQ